MQTIQDGIRVMKLSSGDTLVAEIETLKDQYSYVMIHNPVQFTLNYSGPGTGSMTASRWLETDQKSFKIPRMHIVTSAEPNEMLSDYYITSLDEINEIDDSYDDESAYLDHLETDGNIH